MACRDRLIMAISIAFIVFYSLGIHIGQATFEPKVVTETIVQTVTEYQTVEKIVYVDKPVVEYVDKIVEVPQKLRQFEGLNELEEWLEQNPIDHTKLIYDHGLGDCDDYALELIKSANKDGYEMWFQVLHHPYRQPYTNKLLTKKSADHAICSVIIGNELYYIEPQTDEAWLAGYID